MELSKLIAKSDWNLVTTDKELEAATAQIGAGSGPIAVDVERASGFKYFQKAYLVQLHRRGSGTFLIDPLEISDFSNLYETIRDEEWILHAAGADIESLTELGLTPETIFDTEMASRLLNLERVGLGYVTESLLDIKLEKAFSRANWSTRPLPEPWLKYAALDVLVLPDLRDATHEILEQQQKLPYAKQEFQALLSSKPRVKSEDPWRKLSGIGRLKDSRKLGVAKELWLARDSFAKEADIAPGRIIPDSSIISAAQNMPRSKAELSRNRDFKGPYSRRQLDRWWRAISYGRQNPVKQIRVPRLQPFMPQSIRSWEKKEPAAYARITTAREHIAAASDSYNIPAENLIAPAVLKQISWDPPANFTAPEVKKELLKLGAREWQTELTAQLIADSFVDVQ